MEPGAPHRDLVFISYRRSDEPGTVTALRTKLAMELGDDAVFHDVLSIEPGAPFPDELDAQLRRAAVVLAVIGEQWLTAANRWGQRRIDFEDDWVRIELSNALARSTTTVIPVLVGDTGMPPEKALPDALRDLSTLNAFRLRHDGWDAAVDELTAYIRRRLSDWTNPRKAARPRVGTDADAASDELDKLEAVSEEIARLASELPARIVRQRLLVDTIDEITRLLPIEREAEMPAAAMRHAWRLLHRLIARPLADLTVAISELLRSKHTLVTSTGRWLTFAVIEKRYGTDVTEQRGCLLVRPDHRGLVGDVVIASHVVIGHNRGVTDTKVSPQLVALGPGLGEVDPAHHHA